MTAATMLAQGIAAARAGRSDEARAALLKALELDDRNEGAWLWLSGVMTTPAERRICLENVLAINPANAHARRGLALIEAPAEAPATATTIIAEPLPAPPPEPPEQPTLWLPPADNPGSPARPATGVTIALDPGALGEGPVAAAPPPAARAPEPAPAAPAGTLAVPPIATERLDAEEPCPYCGATTRLGDRSCRACRKGLMVRRQPRDKRSLPLTILAALWGLSSLGALAGGALLIAPLVALAAQAQSLGVEVPIAPLVGLILAVLVGVGLCVMTTVGLFRRQRWAYITHWASLALGIAMTVVWVLLVGVFGAAALAAAPELGEEAATRMAAAAGSLGGVVLCNLLIYGAYIALTVLSHRDFYGEMARMSMAGVSTGEEPYNAGIQYRNRGMWFMAAHAWERAALQAPNDATARRALGLAYAQLRRYEQARLALQEASALAPDDPQLAEDLALVEGLAARGR